MDDRLIRTETGCGFGAGGLPARLRELFPGGRFELCKLGGLLFRYDLFTLCCAIECHHFAEGELAKLAGRNVEA